ncbi:MAG TPA: DUF427 domain-containing protein [Acidimicrobiales bacterium]|nr:DUF427 domain-containing protein [Acidimicrobiales bacterium]
MRTEECRKRIRGVRGGAVVVDSTRTLYGWNDRPYPAYYFPRDDVRLDLLADDQWRETPEGLVNIRWSAMDHWFEEDEEVIVHPRDPHTRVDILASSRRVRVDIDGVTVAESDQPRILFETGLPPRYYLPLTALRMDLLRPSTSHTQCPYKGTASYWSVEVNGRLHEDIAWTYPTPLPESQKIAGLVCFYNHRVDLLIDGVRE